MHAARLIQQTIVTGRYSLSVAILFALAAWSFHLSGDTSYLRGLACCLLIGFLLLWIDRSYTIIRERTKVETILYLLTGACFLPLHAWNWGMVAAVFLLFALYPLMRSFKKNYPQKDLFESFVMLSIGGLFFPKLLLLIPLFFLGASQFLALNLKSLIAAILGFMFPYWMLIPYAIYVQDYSLLTAPFEQLVVFEPIGGSFESEHLILFIMLSVLFFVSTLHYISTSHEDKMRTRVYLSFIIMMGVFLLTYTALQPADAVNMFPLIGIPICLMGAHYFTLTGNRASLTMTIVYLLAFLALFLFTLWKTL